jgi:SET domain-containing protein
MIPEVRPAASRIAWNNPKIGRRPTPAAGYTLYAIEPIAKDELIVVWGGVILTTAQLRQVPEFARDRAIQVEEDLHLCSGMVEDLSDCANHSCNPNAGLRGQITLVAMRDIQAGEEVCFDYAMSDGHPDFYMKCACGQPNCRGAVTGNDWKIQNLQDRYAGYFMPYLQRRIDALRKQK